MNKKTGKINVYQSAILAALTIAAVLTASACAPLTGPEFDTVPAGKGIVNIQILVNTPGDSGNRIGPSINTARTLVPGDIAAGAFDAYDLEFTVSAGKSGTPKSFSGVTSLTAALDPGEYDLAFTAKKGGVSTAAGEYKNIIVTDGGAVSVTVPLVFRPEAGNGTLGFTITRPAGVDLSNAQFVLTPLHAGGTVYGTDWLRIMYEGEKKVTHSSDETVASGYYRALVTLVTPERKAIKSDIVHIGAGQTTTLNWEFAESDFATIIDKIWLVGAMNSWVLPGTEMTAEANGTFAWEGEISGTKDFRFSLLDTSEWPETSEFHTDNDNRWWGHWFAPEGDANVNLIVPVSDPLAFRYYHYTKRENKWILPSDGYYRLIVNPYARTFDIETPVVITGVTITGGNTSINKGSSHTFAAVVNGHNSPNQGVTWSIAGAHVDGTVFSGSTLTIDTSETASTLTVRATSTEDTAKYAEITVMVQAADSPVVSGITVSVADDVAEVSRQAALRFTAAVTASNGATEDVTWSVRGLDKDGNALDSVTSTIAEDGLLTVAADETAVDLVVRATSAQAGFENIYGEAAGVFVRKLEDVSLIGDEFGGWDTGSVQLTYAGRGVYTTTRLMSKDRYFRFRDNSTPANHFEPTPYAENQNPVPSGTIDAWRHEPTQSTSWKTSQGGRYVISLNTVTEKVTFTVTPQVITITGGLSALAPGESGTFTCTAALGDSPVVWAVYGDHINNHEPQEGTHVVEGTLTLGGGEWIGHTLYVTATSLGEFVTWEVPVIDAAVYIVGDMNAWDSNGTLMTRGTTDATKHLFTWTGDLSNNNAFRMHRGGGSNWSRLWFIPGAGDGDVYGVNAAHHTDMPVTRWGDDEGETNKNWQIAGWEGGGYTITFNAVARTLDVTKN